MPQRKRQSGDRGKQRGFAQQIPAGSQQADQEQHLNGGKQNAQTDFDMVVPIRQQDDRYSQEAGHDQTMRAAADDRVKRHVPPVVIAAEHFIEVLDVKNEVVTQRIFADFG